MPKNGYKSHSGYSARARSAIMSGPVGATNSMMPSVVVITYQGERIVTSYFGGPKKGGSQPSATGQMNPFGRRSVMATGLIAPASKPNYLFRFHTNPGPRPYGNGPYA